MKIKKFTFNPFSENTFIVYDDTKECIIIDPGCYENNERKELEKYISDNNLKPIMLINTHCHIDHVFGNQFVCKRWGLDLQINKLDLDILKNNVELAQLYGFENYEISPMPKKFLNENDKINFGNSTLTIILTPGHSPGHISLYSSKEKIIISGDVLFNNGIGRTDLPGGNYDTLIKSIKEKLLVLEDETIVFCGHGPSTTIRKEKLNNPFLS
ncbi:MAG: MBL fold metallo-hydrolase [Flavobacteriales bacterium]|jgi:hydroxyacylglutathione hydrolase|nr:MBL fold metallo-hydrolase [Flavobacteriales bacterium]